MKKQDNHNALIDQLTHDLPKTRALSNRRFWLAALGSLLVLSTMILLVFGLRENWHQMAMIWKPALFLFLAVSCALCVVDLARPQGVLRLMHLSGVSVSVLILLAVIIDGDVSLSWHEMLHTVRVHAYEGFWVVGSILLLGSALFALLWQAWLKRSASERPKVMGAVSGMGVGALSGAAFALHCNVEDLLYFTLFYVSPMLLLTLVGGALGRRLRW